MNVCRLVVRSVGTATPAAALALAHALPFSREHLARCVYQAPSVLLDGLPDGEATAIRDLLLRTGLDVTVAAANETPALGGPEYEVAVHVGDAARFREVAAELARFIGCTPARAVELLCASPAIVLAQVSLSTVQALGDRLAPLGAQLDASRLAEARYDLFVDAADAELRQRLLRELRAADIECHAEGPLLASGVDRAFVTALWRRHGGRSGWRLLDQALQRYDLWLDAPVAEGPATEALLACTGMPRALLPRVHAALPFLLVDCAPATQAREALWTLHQAGVLASARLVTLSTWDVSLTAVPDPRAAATVLVRVGRLDEAGLAPLLMRTPARLKAGLTLPRARWLVAELAAVGCVAELEPR